MHTYVHAYLHTCGVQRSVYEIYGHMDRNTLTYIHVYMQVGDSDRTATHVPVCCGFGQGREMLRYSVMSIVYQVQSPEVYIHVYTCMRICMYVCVRVYMYVCVRVYM